MLAYKILPLSKVNPYKLHAGPFTLAHTNVTQSVLSPMSADSIFHS